MIELLLAGYTVAVSWVAPIEREDNTALPADEIAKYRVYRETTPGSYVDDRVIDQWGEKDGKPYMVWWVSTDEMRCYVMTAVDTDGRESEFSQRFCANVPPAEPGIKCSP